MKKIEAILRPGKLDVVKEALRDIGVSGVTAVEVVGYGRQRGHMERYGGAEYVINFARKVKIDVVVEDSHLPAVIAAIRTAASTGAIGDGKIFVSALEDAIRIRTGENGVTAV